MSDGNQDVNPKSETRNPKQISNFNSQTSDFKPQISDFKSQISNLKSQSANYHYAPVPVECLHHGTLRPDAQQRLERLQQAAHPRLANLVAVERVEDRLCLKWQFVPGESLSKSMDDLPEDEIYRVLRDLIDAVQGLHALGLVHGNLSADNVILGADGVYLTDASALLLTDPETDIESVARIMHQVLDYRGLSINKKRAGLVAAHERSPRNLRTLASQLDGGYLPPAAPGRSARRLKRNNLLWAIALAVLAIIAAALVAWYCRRPNPGVLRSTIDPSNFYMHLQ